MSGREPLSVTIPAELADPLREAVASGEFRAVEEALADAISIWSRRHEEQEEELAWIRARIKASLADPGPSLSIDEVRSRMKEVSERSRLDDDAAA